MEGDDYLVSAALLSRGHDAATLVADLAARFERSLPSYVEVQRRGWGRHKTIKAISISLGSERFRIEVDHEVVHPWIDHVVRGICLKSDEVTMDHWLDQLALTLNREATKSVETRLAIDAALQ